MATVLLREGKWIITEWPDAEGSALKYCLAHEGHDGDNVQWCCCHGKCGKCDEVAPATLGGFIKMLKWEK